MHRYACALICIFCRVVFANTTRLADEAASGDYTVEVNGVAVPVYTAQCNKPELGDRYSFASFDLSAPAKVKISSLLPLEKLEIRPREAKVAPRVEAKTIFLELNSPAKLSIEPNGRVRPLLLFAEKPQHPPATQDTRSVIFFGPGVHKPAGEKITLVSNQTLYLAPGAILKAAVEAKNAEHINILGRGIIDGSDWPWLHGPGQSLVRFEKCNDVKIEGVTLSGSFAWTLVPFECENVLIRDVKIVNGRVMNDDGINPCNSQHVRIEDCFIRTDDDCIALKGIGGDRRDVRDISVSNCVLWCDRARIVLMGHESQAAQMTDITFRDIFIIHYSMTAFLLEPGENMTMSNVTFRAINIDSDGRADLMRLHPTVNQYMKDRVPGHIRNVTFRDSVIHNSPRAGIEISGADAEHQVENVSIQNVRLDDHVLTEADLKLGPFAQNISVKPSSSADK